MKDTEKDTDVEAQSAQKVPLKNPANAWSFDKLSSELIALAEKKKTDISKNEVQAVTQNLCSMTSNDFHSALEFLLFVEETPHRYLSDYEGNFPIEQIIRAGVRHDALVQRLSGEEVETEGDFSGEGDSGNFSMNQGSESTL